MNFLYLVGMNSLWLLHYTCFITYIVHMSIGLGLGLGLWYLMPLSTIFQLYRGGQIYRRKKTEYQEKTTDLPQVTDNFII